MGLLDLLRAGLALAFTLGLVGLAAFLLRRFAPGLVLRLQSKVQDRRMRVVETLVLGPAQRLVLVSVDERERLIILGDGREVGPLEAPRRRSQAQSQ